MIGILVEPHFDAAEILDMRGGETSFPAVASVRLKDCRKGLAKAAQGFTTISLFENGEREFIFIGS